MYLNSSSDNDDIKEEKKLFKKLLKSWQAWLTTPEGGSVEDRVVAEHYRQIELMAAWLLYSRKQYVNRSSVKPSNMSINVLLV